MADDDALQMARVAAATPGLRRAMELLTARQMVADGLLTFGEFESVVARVLLEVGVPGLVGLLAAQSTLTSILAQSMAGEDGAAEAIAGVSRLLSLVEGAAR